MILKKDQKKIFGGLKRLFGEDTFGGFKTDPILTTAWWRRRYP